eukprot:2020113-Prymnesium_polylepis.1
MKVLRENVHCRSSSSIHVDYSQLLVGGLSVHSTPARQTGNLQLAGAHRNLPYFCDRVIADEDGDIWLSHIVADYVTAAKSTSDFDPTAVFVSGFAPTMLMWLNDIAAPQEKKLFAGFINELRVLSSSRQPPAPGPLQALATALSRKVSSATIAPELPSGHQLSYRQRSGGR